MVSAIFRTPACNDIQIRWINISSLETITVVCPWWANRESAGFDSPPGHLPGHSVPSRPISIQCQTERRWQSTTRAADNRIASHRRRPPSYNHSSSRMQQGAEKFTLQFISNPPNSQITSQLENYCQNKQRLKSPSINIQKLFNRIN